MSNTLAEIASKEHDGSGSPVFVKKVGTYGWDATALVWSKLLVDSFGFLKVTAIDGVVSSASLSNVSSSATTVSLLASNTSRKRAMFFNDSTSALYIKYGTTASTSSFTVKLLAGAYFEMPSPVYTGAVDGIWDSANGAVRITEL